MLQATTLQMEELSIVNQRTLDIEINERIYISKRIDDALASLLLRINTIPKDSARYKEAKKLYADLNGYATTFKDGIINVRERNKFSDSCETAISKAKSSLSLEPGWGDYLITLAKKLVNAVVSCLSFGYNQGFFKFSGRTIHDDLVRFTYDSYVNVAEEFYEGHFVGGL